MPETIEQIISIAAAEKEVVTPRQVKRWQVAGLLTSPDIQRLGKGKGTRTLYPDGTGKLAAVISARQERRLLDSAWSLWWEGFPVPLKSVRAFLSEFLANRRQTLAELVDTERGCLTEQAIDAIDDAVDKDRTIPGTLRARQKIGKDKFRFLLVGILHMATGVMQEDDIDCDDFERVFCPFGDWMNNPYGATIDSQDYQQLTAFLPSVWICKLSDADMLNVRDEARNLLKLVGFVASMVAPELAEQWRLLLPTGEEPQVLCFLAWAKLRTLPSSSLLNVETQCIEGFRRYNLMVELLRIEVPAVVPFLKLGNMATTSKRAQKRHLQRLSKAYKENKEELDAFFQRHPELR